MSKFPKKKYFVLKYYNVVNTGGHCLKKTKKIAYKIIAHYQKYEFKKKNSKSQVGQKSLHFSNLSEIPCMTYKNNALALYATDNSYTDCQ